MRVSSDFAAELGALLLFRHWLEQELLAVHRLQACEVEHDHRPRPNQVPQEAAQPQERLARLFF